MCFRRAIVVPLLVLVLCAGELAGATLFLQSTKIGSTPQLLGYNSGHFVPDSNTADWWRYSHMSGARLFITPGVIEPSDDISGFGDGVTNQATFLSRKTALRANPLDTNFINWPIFTNGFRATATHGSNLLNVDHAASKLRQLGVEILVNIGASQSDFPIADTNDWAGKWELWQHFYAEAFYLGREYSVERYQMFNEPDHASAGGLTLDDYLQRLQLTSDAIQCAAADVNQRYGKLLKARLLAPVTAGNVNTTYASWGRTIVTNRHLNFLGQTDTNFWLIGQYDYHEYNSTPATFGSRLAALHSSLAADMSPEPRFPTSISEFNVHTASTFDTLPETLDSPSKYARFGAIVANLVSNSCNELYCFKFSQTLFNDSIPIKKNGMHYVDNTNAPYNIGGITKAGEAWRLFSKAVAPKRDRLSILQGIGTGELSLVSTFDPLGKRYHLFSANESSDVDLTLNVNAWSLPSGQRVLLEEVSEDCYGAAKVLLTVGGNQIVAGTHRSNTVWMFSIPTQPQAPLQTVLAAEDATVIDGTNRALNFGTNTMCFVKNNSTNASQRDATLLKFRLPTIYLPDIQFALLTVRAASIGGADLVQAHVYGVTNNNWLQSTVTWSNAPGLAQNIGAGISVTNNVVLNANDSAQMVGQIVADAIAQDRMVDVTRFIQEQNRYDASFLLSRDVRFHGDVQDDDGVSIVSREGDTNSGPRLLIVRLLDSDNDGISDEAERSVFGTNPNNADTDGDGVSDGEEILVRRTDPGHFSAVPPYILRQPSDRADRAGATVSFDVAASGAQPLRYQWFFDGTEIGAATNSRLTLVDVQTNQSGNYNVVVSNAFGVVTSSNALLVVTNDSSFVINEPFNYAVGQQLAGQGGWILNGGSSGTIESGNLSVPGLVPATGNQFTWPGASMSVRLPLGTNITEGAVYFSFALRVDALGSGFTGIGTLAGFTTGTGTEFATKVNIRTNGIGGFQLGTSKATGTTFGSWAPVNFFVGETVFIVGRYTFASANGTDDTCDLWLNPDSATFGAAVVPVPDVAMVGNGGSDLTQIDRFFFRSGAGNTAVAKLVTDELRVGSSWFLVTAPTPVVLAISPGEATATLSWPLHPGGLFLEESSDLVSVSWSRVNGAPETNGGLKRITLAATNKSRFFRLSR